MYYPARRLKPSETSALCSLKELDFFDEKGVLQDAELIFIEVEEYPVDFFEFRQFLDKQVSSTDKIIVDKSHLPLKIWRINKDGTKELIYRYK